MDDEVVTDTHARYKPEADNSHGMQRLVIDTAAKSDEGAFKCKAENCEGVASTTGYLSVTGTTSRKAKSHDVMSCLSRTAGAAKETSSDSGRSHRRLHREQAISVPTPLGTIIEQKSVEEQEAARMQAAQQAQTQVCSSIFTSRAPVGDVMFAGIHGQPATRHFVGAGKHDEPVSQLLIVER